MQVLSATDAIQPAWDHARRMTLAPRSWRLALKITALGFFARVSGCNGNFSRGGSNLRHLPMPAMIALTGVLVLLSVVAIVIALIFFYISSRLQFVLLDSVLRSDTTIAPIWRRYGRATWYWIGLKIAFLVVALICVSPILIPVLIQFFHAARAGGADSHPGAFLMAIFSFIGAIFFIVLVIGVGYTLLQDFGLPSMALEGTSLGETVRRVWRLMCAEPGQVLLYLVMRFVMGIAASIVCVVLILLGMFVASIPFGGIGVTAWLSLRHAGLSGHIFMIGAWILLGVIFAVVVALIVIMLFGYAQVFFQAYALYFLGGRYPLVGAYLEPFVPEVYGYPPPGYPPAGPPVAPES